MMKKLLAIATLLLASSAAQAQYTFEFGGHTIRIDPDRGTVQIPGVYDNTGKRSKRTKAEDSGTTRKPKSQEARTDSKTDSKTDSQSAPAIAPAPAPVPTEQAAAPAAPAVTAPTAPAATAEPSTTTAAVAPDDTAVAPAAPSAPPQANQQDAAPTPPAPAPTVAAAPPSPTSPPPSAVVQANSPVGVWLTEEREGKVRIEQCGVNLCGYSVDKKSNQNGEQVLINMKPGKDKWSGRILDPTTGSTYDSTIALKGSDTLRVQGCAFGGVFCGGQTWTRVN
jgi:Uncharacterized protein conserved in bacteria (DUF2147)